MAGTSPLTAELIRVADEYYIHPTSSFADDRTRVLKHGETFGVFDRFGDILAIGKQEQGLYHEGTRFLSRSMLLLDGRRPLLLSSTISQDNSLMTVDLANAAPDRDGVVEQEVIHLLRSRFLWDETCHERLHLLNYGREAVQVSLDYEFDADFADIFEVRGTDRVERGTRQAAAVGRASVTLPYRGRDEVTRATHLKFTRKPDELTPTRAHFQLTLEVGKPLIIEVSVTCEKNEALPSAEAVPYRRARKAALTALREAESGASRVETSNEQFNDWINRSLADLQMMVTETPNGPYVYAGVPWFSTAFGRDGLITALEMLWVKPEVATGVLRFLAATQADDEDAERDAEPGKILHETRLGEMAATGEIPFGRYYGSVDATPLFVLLAGEYYQATGDEPLIRDIWPNIERALEWIDHYGDIDGDGFVEYERHSRHGLANQGWKDSWDAVFHADGSDVAAPIALCEVQGYVYAAKRHAARLARLIGDVGRSEELDRQATLLRERFDEAFWCEDIGTYALALDGDKNPCRVRTSNAGHCLFTGIALPERAPRVAGGLLADESFSGWGIRTLASGQARYNPMSYHNGSVWPHDNAIIAAGFARYGLKQEAVRVLTGMFDASLFVDLHRLPELVCGFDRREREGPTLYPVACSPQSWASAAPFMLLKASLGLTLDAPNRVVRFDHPELPHSLREVRISGLRVGDSQISVAVRRYPADVAITVIERAGDVRIEIVK